MNKGNLSSLFSPRTIALIGASGTPGKVGNIVLGYLERSGAQLFLVNPKGGEIGSRRVYPSPEDLPEKLDLAVITVGAEAAVTAAETCAQKGTAFVIIIAGGFGEVGGRGKSLEERLKALPERYGCRILGPNSLGVFFPESGLDTIFVEHGDRALAEGGGIAFITQSGSVGVESLGLASNAGFGMRAFVGTGNKADLNEHDFLDYFGADSGTSCLAFYLESIESGREFLEQAGAIAAKKPVVVLKAGRTAAGGAAVSSHTGRLAGSDNVVDGAFRQYGIQRAYDDEELCDAAKALSMVRPAAGNRVAVITPAGGFGVMCTDYIESPDRRANLTMAHLAPATVTRIRKVSLPFASAANPVDLTAGADDTMFLETLKALLEDDGVDIVICITFFAPPSISKDLPEKMATLIRKAEKPVLIFTQYGPFTAGYLKRFYELGVAGFSAIRRTVRAARFLVERGMILRLKEAKDEK
ncbi:MAG: CoA-binding protein [Spirochaetales bacterium]|nr:CoA-binding protein [Spirochaetales bacterium]